MANDLKNQIKSTSITFLPLREAREAAIVGGKAASLGSLLRAGLPCPDGIVLPVSAYRLHTEKAFREIHGPASDEQRAAAILNTDVDPELASDLRTALTDDIHLPVAVRSSATFEDGAKASCAGQFETFLNVSSLEETLLCIRKTWASFWSTHARQYASRQDSHDDGGMAVIIQSMVNPLFSGVAFTVDPTAADPDVSYIEWVRGSGELLVSGDKIAGRAWITRDGTVLRADYLSQDASPPQSFWKHIANLLQSVESIYSAPQDIEWTWSSEQLIVLQSRPITKLHPITDGVPPPWCLVSAPVNGWNDSHRKLFDLWDEYNPPTVKPLEMELFMGAVWQASLDMLNDGSGAPGIERAIVLFKNLPIQIDPTASQKNHSRWPRGETLSDLQSAMLSGAAHVNQMITAFKAKPANDCVGLMQVLEEVAAIHRTLNVTRLRHMQSWIDGEFAAKQVLEPLISATGRDVEPTLEKLVAGVEHDTNRMNRELSNLAEGLRSGRTPTWEKTFESFLQQFGHFQNDGIPIGESPDSVFRQIQQMATDNCAKTFPNTERVMAEVESIRTAIAANARPEFDRAVLTLRHWLEVRENTKTRAEIARSLLRQIAGAIGNLLLSRAAIQHSDDIWLLTLNEIRSVCVEGKPLAVELLATRHALLAWKATRSWLPAGFIHYRCRAEDSVWRGLPGSPGSASGPARIVAGPAQFGDVRAGDIVVARSTNPVWTQLFARIGGIIVENGSRLSHAAVVAREYGIPAVVGLPGILDVIRDGDKVSVNGDTGEVFGVE